MTQTLEVRSDNSAVLRVLGFQFRHFLASSGSHSASHRVRLRLSGRSPALWVNGHRRASLQGSARVRHALALVLETLLDSVSGHLLFHAGVVSDGERGMLICGPPGFGKTSLVMKLAAMGFGFLSDDYAPIALDTGWVSPFPRSLGIVAASRQATRRLREIPPARRVLYGDKWLVDPAGIRGLRLGDPCRPAVVLLLGPPEPALGSAVKRYEICVAPDRVEALRRILPGNCLHPRRRARGSRGRVFRFSLPTGMDLSGSLQTWAHENRSSVYALSRLYDRAGAFRPPLRVHRVTPKDGLIELLGDLQNRRPGSQGPGKAGGSPAGLLLQAASLLGGASFYRFQGGSLGSRAEAAADILRGNSVKRRGRDDRAG